MHSDLAGNCGAAIQFPETTVLIHIDGNGQRIRPKLGSKLPPHRSRVKHPAGGQNAGVSRRSQRFVRIAVLSFGGRLHYVEAGSRLGAAYEVVAVGSNAVDLLALDTNTPRRLVQR